jgi:hypothetical protein
MFSRAMEQLARRDSSCHLTSRLQKCLHLKMTDEQINLFWSKVDKDCENGCWEWTAARNWFGYGVWGTNKGGNSLSHRTAWSLKNGPIPKGIKICHRCDNPPCCNPDHLFSGTQKQNLQDCASKGRTSRGVNRKHAKLNEEKVREIITLNKSGLSQNKLAIRFMVTRSVIGDVVHRRGWAHVKI